MKTFQFAFYWLLSKSIFEIRMILCLTLKGGYLADFNVSIYCMVLLFEKNYVLFCLVRVLLSCIGETAKNIIFIKNIHTVFDNFLIYKFKLNLSTAD